MEKDYKDKLKKATWKWKGGKSTTTTTTTDGGGTATVISEEEGGGDGAGGGELTELYDQELVEGKIRDINEKWKLEVEKLESEKVWRQGFLA